MTFQKFEQLFKSKYPTGRAWMHNDMCRDQWHLKDKVAIEFQPHGKLYFYDGAYEDVLCKIGVPTISRQRLDCLESTLSKLEETNGKPDEFFGFMVDNTKEINSLAKQISEIKATHVVV